MLILHRKEGEVTFGGFELDPMTPESTCDHAIAIKELEHGKFGQHVLIEVVCRDGSLFEYELHPGCAGACIDGDIVVTFLGSWRVRDGSGHDVVIARIGFDAPRAYRIMRDNAVKGKPDAPQS